MAISKRGSTRVHSGNTGPRPGCRLVLTGVPQAEFALAPGPGSSLTLPELQLPQHKAWRLAHASGSLTQGL